MFNGTIPTEIGLLNQLTTLWLSKCNYGIESFVTLITERKRLNSKLLYAFAQQIMN